MTVPVHYHAGHFPPRELDWAARFVPISAEQLLQAMSTWEYYIHAQAPDRLVQLAILHAEFEALRNTQEGYDVF